MTRLGKGLARLLVSAGLLAVLLVLADREEFRGVWGRIRWELLPPFLLLTAVLEVAFAYRWHVMLDGAVGFRRALAASVLGLGGNMVLPARGGDLLRVYHSVHRTQATAHLALARLFLEKVLDLGTVLLAGCAALAFLGLEGKPGTGLAVVVSSTVLLAGLAGTLILARTHSEALAAWTRRLFGAIRLGRVFDRYVHRLFHELRESADLRKLARPLLLTLAMWLAVYSGAYILAAEMVGIALSYPEALVLLLAGAVGLAVPAAPSGLGTFHAAVASGYVLLGRPLHEGILVATAIHACYFFALLAPAAALYPFAVRRAGTGLAS